MRVKRIFCGLVVCLLIILFSMSVMASRELEITGIRVYVDGDRDTSADEKGGSIDNDVIPGAKIKIKITMKNTFSSEDDVDIENIDVRATLKDIDLGADLDESLDEFDLTPGKKKDASLEFLIPESVYDGSYSLDLTIDAKANDDDRTKYSKEIKYYVYVVKKEHDIRVASAQLNNTKLNCGEQATLNIRIQNYGSTDETLSRVSIKSNDLVIDYSTIFSLKKKIEANNNVFSRSYPILIPLDTKEGTHSITVSTYYRTDMKVDTKLVPVTITCNKNINVNQDQTNDKILSNGGSTTKDQPSDNKANTNTPKTVDNSSQNVPDKNKTSSNNLFVKILLITMVNLMIICIGTLIIYLVIGNKKKKKFMDDDDDESMMSYY